MLNPSTADEFKLDPSCTRARVFAEHWGFGALLITNLFSWRSTDPDDLKITKNPVGRGNDAAILEAARAADLVVCAWGNHGGFLFRSDFVLNLLQKNRIRLHALRETLAGEPAHPLYLPGNLEPYIFKPSRLTISRSSS